MFFKTSGNKAETSLPNVIAMIVLWIASFLKSRSVVGLYVIANVVPFVCILGTTNNKMLALEPDCLVDCVH